MSVADGVTGVTGPSSPAPAPARVDGRPPPTSLQDLPRRAQPDGTFPATHESVQGHFLRAQSDGQASHAVLDELSDFLGRGGTSGSRGVIPGYGLYGLVGLVGRGGVSLGGGQGVVPDRHLKVHQHVPEYGYHGPRRRVQRAPALTSAVLPASQRYRIPGVLGVEDCEAGLGAEGVGDGTGFGVGGEGVLFDAELVAGEEEDVLGELGGALEMKKG